MTDDKGQAIPAANILLLRPADSLLIKGVLTDANGYFRIDQIKTKEGVISVRMTGYKRKDTHFSFTGADTALQLGSISLITVVSNLKQVEIIEQKPLYEQKIDRLVVNVSNNIATAGGTVIDVLERSPGVSVERQSGSISLNARDGVQIMINGKVSRLPMDAVIQMLSSMSSSNIDRIELISNPGARYEASGNGGIINIILKKPADLGTKGSYNIILGYGKHEKAGVGLNLNHRTEKLNTYLDLSFYRNHTEQHFENSRMVHSAGDNVGTATVSERDPVTTNYSGLFGMDYMVNKQLTIGGYISAYSNKWVMDADNLVSIDTNNISSGGIKINNHETSRWQNLAGNIYLAYSWTDGSTLSLDADYLYYNNSNPTTYRNRYFNESDAVVIDSNLRAEKHTPVNIWVAKLDYTKKLGEKMELETGAKGSFSKFTNDVSLDELSNGKWANVPGFTVSAPYNENIGAVYAALNTTFSKSTRLNVGLRYEYADISLKGTDVKTALSRSFSNLFPTFFFAHDINKKNTIQFSYGRRITRPAFSDLAPFVIFLDPTAYYYGNAALLPAIADGIKLDYKYDRYLLSLQYSHESNAFAQRQPVINDSSSVEILTTLNLKYRNTYSLIFTAPVNIIQWWNLQLNVLGSYREVQTSHLDENFVRRQTSARVNVVQRFKLPAKFTLELSTLYRTPSITGISKTAAAGSVDLGIQRKIQQGKGNIRLNINDIFWTNIDKLTLYQPANNLDVKILYRYEPRVIRLNYTYNFGNTKVKNRAERETGANEIDNRVN
ncbi:outer membrane beta-barrel family protein [Chitinophaga oryziterrae]